MRAVVKVAALSLALGLAACGGDDAGDGGAAKAPSKKIDEVTFAVAVKAPDPGQIFIFSPEGGGYFAKEGLKVNPLFNDGGQAALQQVATGKAEFGLSSVENLINGVANGLPLKAFATVLTRTIYHHGVGVLESSPITSYEQLKGKSIGVSAFTSGAYPFAQGALAEAGLDPKKDVKFAITGSGGPAAEALESGKVAGIVTTETQWATIQSLGVKVRFLEPPPSSGNLPADVLVARPDFLERNKDLATRFARAVMQGTVAALANPQAAADAYAKQFPTAAGAKKPEENLAILNARLDDMRQVPGQNGKWGYMPIEEYEKVQEHAVEYGVIKKPQNLQDLFTNELIDAINDFDPAAVEQAAAAK